MSVLSSAALLTLVLLTETSATVQPRLPDCETSPSRIELSAEPTSEVLEVCISPELPTTFRFDSLLESGAVELQGHERFEDVATGTRSFTALPPADLQPGERFKVVVRFADGAAPTSATFVLVGHPALGTRRVDVFRHKRTVEDYQQEAREERKKAQQLGQELERMRQENGPGGLTGLIASGLLMTTEVTPGVEVRPLMRDIIQFPGHALPLAGIISYRSTTRAEDVTRVAVAVMLRNPGTQSWEARGAALLDKRQETKPVQVVWQPSPIHPNAKEPGVVVVELELTAQEIRGPFTLKLWDESGRRLVTLGNVTFP